MTLRRVKRVLYVDDQEVVHDVTGIHYATSPASAVEVGNIHLYIDDNPRPPMTVRLQVSAPNPVAPGTPVRLEAVATGGLEPHGFTFAASPDAPPLAGAGPVRNFVVPADAPNGATYTFQVTASDSGAPQLSASDTYTLGVQVVPDTPDPDPLTAVINQTPGNPVTRNASINYQAVPSGGTPPFNFNWSKSTGSPAWTGTGPARQMTVPANAPDEQTWSVTATITDSGTPPQVVTATRSTRVNVDTAPPVGNRKLFPGRMPKMRVGMSAAEWNARWNEVARTNLSARRIYADLGAGANNNMARIEDALNAGLTPLISYKGQPTTTNESRARTTAATLQSLGVPVIVTWFHEPSDNLTPAVWQQGNNMFGPIFKAQSRITFGPIFNGFHLDRQQALITDYNPDSLFEAGYWDWFGIDTYQAGTQASPQSIGPAERFRLLQTYLRGRGFGNWQVLIGEYNTWTAAELREAHNVAEELVNDNGDPFIWMLTMWNSTTGKGAVLTGDRLTEFNRFLNQGNIWRPGDPV